MKWVEAVGMALARPGKSLRRRRHGRGFPLHGEHRPTSLASARPGSRVPVIDENFRRRALPPEPEQNHAENAEHHPGRRIQDLGDHGIPHEGSHMGLDRGLGCRQAVRVELDHCWPKGVNTHAPPPARLLVASMTAATMASRRSQTPMMRNNRSMGLNGLDRVSPLHKRLPASRSNHPRMNFGV